MTRRQPLLHARAAARAGLPAGTTLDPRRLERIAPESVSRAVFVRLARLGPEAAAFARAVAILGEGSAFSHAAELAGLGEATATQAFDALAVAEILRGAEPLGFVHPLVAQAIEAEIGAGERSDLHRAAARLLARDGAGPEEVAVHLAQAGGRGDAWAVATLRDAAARALAQGATETAADWLAPCPRGAGARRGSGAPCLPSSGGPRRPSAGRRPSSACRMLPSWRPARRRAGAELRRPRPGAGPAGTGRRGRGGLRTRARASRRPRLGARPGAARGVVVGGDAGRRRCAPRRCGRRSRSCRRRAISRPPASASCWPSWRCSAPSKVASAARWWRSPSAPGAPASCSTSGAGDGVAWTLVSGALLVADEVERGLEVCEAALADARRRGSPMAFANACYCRAWPLFAQGRVNDSVADSEAALAARDDGWSAFLGTATAMLVMGLVERGESAEAREALALVEDSEVLRASTQYPMILVAGGAATGRRKPARGGAGSSCSAPARC